ncbi:UDP-2,4-diacetamido-2,4,6-trideoxy-beta-L-altropyranose hydrolase [Pseudomonas sp. SWRI92]|uniref:UDP-2,4-diacetamido-2,4, 6-trideoxy-beta-L-altropyranose hydrolase n=1 Tax=Pseudomonas sp. SWRI92 TaxID=2745499 RepID=UPI001649489D|nr:UDP-2,4-diacetamido-2,4,6-trideoxy-beta-L-altropyranose hydrolase [Pseudomonas sp. SWRI92]MBC3374682.1 UDP-2,4-diacetamido-2,4,6-trideoxy-beta-L-altropyranose hydrolase [Pseudomonas sp. SWRI92]
MKVVFRADASLQIGSGHVMRCLTLAEALRAEGADCHFICREHPGNLLAFISDKGFIAHKLPVETDVKYDEQKKISGVFIHDHWLGATQEQDALASGSILELLKPDWLIVDHYALNVCWEKNAKQFCRKLMVIDDLADRQHLCDLLLDQNLGRQPLDYAPLVPLDCELLTGPAYALLRSEFSELRSYSLERRTTPNLKNLLITMGGVDENNATGLVLNALKATLLPEDVHITVVMGAAAPWLANVQCLAKEIPYPTEVVFNISDMAKRMAASDLAIGAAGSTSWERCCLGLPSLMVVLADNQSRIGDALHSSGAAILLGCHDAIDFCANIKATIESFAKNKEMQKRISSAAANVTDGTGCMAVVTRIKERS